MADELINFENEVPVRSSGKKKKKKRAHPWAFPLGLAITVLSIIGLITVILAGIGTVNYISYKAKNIDEYNKMLIPVVMNDPDMFDDITKADMNQLLDISIWSILKSGLSPDDYEYVEGNMIIPEDDVTAEYTKLFGTELAPVHATVTGYGYDFVYNSAEKYYVIPLTGIEPTYTPSVTDVDKKSNTVVLTVAYLASDGWAQNSEGEMVAPEPDKFVKITLREKDGNQFISSMQMTSTPEVATTQAVVTTTEPETEAESATEEASSAEEAAAEQAESAEEQPETAIAEP
jgi:hypothetical protein